MAFEFQDLSNFLSGLYDENLKPNGWEKISLKEKLTTTAHLVKDYEIRGILPKTGYEFPLGVQIELTYKCNLKCIHCYNNSGKPPYNKEMELSDWERISREIVTGGCLAVTFSGGEPLCAKEKLYRMIDIFSNHGVSIF